MPANETMPLPRSVAHAVVIKDEDIFFLSERDGAIPSGNRDGFGLYYHDCRFLDGYEVRIAGTSPNPLAANADRGSIAHFELTNEQLHLDKGKSVAPQKFGITLQRVIDSRGSAVHDKWTVENYDFAKHSLPLSFSFHSGFEDIFEIRGLHPRKTGREQKPRWKNGVLVFNYKGADGMNRRLAIHLDPKPDKAQASNAEFKLNLDASARAEINVSFVIFEQQKSQEKSPQARPPASKTDHVQQEIGGRLERWLKDHAEIHSNDQLLNHVMRRSLLDLLMLQGSLDGLNYISAGLPWYGTLFGRDSIIACMETLAYEPDIAAESIRLLAKYQGSKENEFRDEQPGKILREFRRGELANLNEIPQTPYYGSVDSTPLFLILIGEHANWTGNLQLFDEVRPNIERALGWIDNYGQGKNGYLCYATRSRKGLGNQGWKDSGDAIMNADGSLAIPPIALVEVQGYVYRAKLLIADLYARSRDNATAKRLRKQANDLKSRFNQDFWLEDKNFYALALQKGDRPAAVISSNPGQALWTGIVDESRATAVVRQLTAPDMFSGWGVRTLSTLAARANPIGYHLGTVWPHDNSMIAAGFRRYGFDAEAVQVLSGIVEAARHFEHYRLPEVFGGFSRKQFKVPVRYPVACHPQAWAAGSVPFLVTSLLGLVPDAFSRRLRIVRPVLPATVDELEFRRIRVGKGSVDLRFRRARGNVVEVEAENARGVDVRVEAESEPRAA